MATRKKTKRPATKRRAARAKRRPQRHRPESLRLRALAPSLTVADLERSLAWYRDGLGFTAGERWEEPGRFLGVQLKAGTVEIMLNQDDFAKGHDRAKGIGLRLWVTTAQDLDAVAARVRAAGGTITQEPGELPWGDRAFSCVDPDGYQWTVVAA